MQDFFFILYFLGFCSTVNPSPLIPDLIVRVFRFVITEDALITKLVIFSWELDFTTFIGYTSAKTPSQEIFSFKGSVSLTAPNFTLK